MKQQNQSDKQKLLEQLYGAFDLCNSGNEGVYARSPFHDISNLVDRFGVVRQCWDYVNANAIIYSRDNGTVYCKRKKKEGGYYPKDLYERENLLEDYKLHVFAAEKNVSAVGSSVDILIGITDKEGFPIYTGSFDYSAIDRSIYDPLIYHISRVLKQELNRYLLSHRDLSTGGTERIVNSIVFSLLSMSPELLKETKLRFKNSKKS